MEEGRGGPEAAFRMRIRKFPVVVLNQYIIIKGSGVNIIVI